MRMEQMPMAKQMVEISKAALGNGFNLLIFMQDHTEKMINSFLEQAPWIPEEGKKALNEWGDNYKRGRDTFKRAIDESFEKMEGYFTQADGTEGPKAE